MRYSIMDMFGIVTFCAIVSWCALQVGFDNPMFWVAAFASAVLSAVFVFLAGGKKSRRFTPLVPLPFLLCCFIPVMSISLLTNGALLFVAGLFCACLPPMRVRTLWTMTLICAAVAQCAGTLPGISAMRELRAMREEFPKVSLASRLLYEQRSSPSTDAPLLVMSAEVSDQLDDFENELYRGNNRKHDFYQIHSHQYENFVRAMGFGVTRMGRPVPERLRRPPLRDIPFDKESVAKLETIRYDWRAFENAGKSDDVEHLHRVSRSDFLDFGSFGVSVDSGERVVGFVEHGFHYSPVGGFEEPERWDFSRLELVSLLKFDGPRVYVLDRLPRMDQLSNDKVPTRPLDEFEADALDQLRTEKDIVISQQGSEYRMLGSLRAVKQCMECHSVNRGELLGAFSYVLYRTDIIGAR